MGTTKFDPLPDVGTIMITGGAGFMYDLNPSTLIDFAEIDEHKVPRG